MTAATRPDFTVLIVAKAPVPGLAKTRLCPPLTSDGAADVAAAALLDTLRVSTEATEGNRTRVVVSMTGDLATSARHTDLVTALAGCHVVEQRGATFGERLRHAHEDAATLGARAPVVQIGMDTPHADPTHLVDAARHVNDNIRSAAIGAATDGGWWLLALTDPAHALALVDVPMSRPDTGTLTRSALTATGLALGEVTPLCDVDTWADATAVATSHPHTLFADAVRRQRTRAGVAV
ncbi:MAG TPA: DUF2064 domain-containing protein [Actinomycetes bacterium]|nr:DUF2064 domain-containing protein [Actinomycetes bacterium]